MLPVLKDEVTQTITEKLAWYMRRLSREVMSSQKLNLRNYRIGWDNQKVYMSIYQNSVCSSKLAVSYRVLAVKNSVEI